MEQHGDSFTAMTPSFCDHMLLSIYNKFRYVLCVCMNYILTYFQSII